jgi:VanZ family protein
LKALLLRKWWPFWVDWVLVILCMGTIFYYSSQLHPDVPGIEFSPFRKTLHVSEYVLLFVLWGRALLQTWPGNFTLAVRWALLATIGYSASDELHQHFVGRDGNVIDVLIDSALPLLSWLWLEARQRTVRRPQPPTG